ncbi:GGDEF domain-containing protein [Capsulimonas corticalis]|uniref:GGDEF domain-containing protein n=1 Tax=Capsulimonas corticalis TaxID=2219043 RepID=A0A402D4R4_9BACT|nr:ligand-binding sensor domain-containing diguanylate cyclase [Capsulimonas corticalis]BDI29290.1 GGDEF domain-containing protein [Capsulimonas corticalis]
MWTKTSRHHFIIFSLLCVFFAAKAAHSAPISLANRVALVWNTHDGLPQDHVKSILQARDGYIWVATQDGAARFDGKQFTTYDTGRTPGLATNNIEQLLEDGDGNLWACGEGGISRFHDGVAENLTPPVTGRGDLNIRCLLDPSGHLWAERYGDYYTVSGNSLHVAVDSSIIDRRSRTAWAPGVANSLWVGTRQGAVIEVRDGAIRRFQLPGVSRNAVLSLQCAPNGAVWVGSEQGMFLIQDGAIRRIAGQPAGASPATIVSDGTMVWGLRNGRLYQIRDEQATLCADFPETNIQSIGVNADGSLFCRYHSKEAGADCVALFIHGAFLSQTLTGRISGAAICALSDRAGNIWIGMDHGLACLRDRNCRTFGPESGLPSRLPAGILFSDLGGRLWAANDYGIYSYSGGTSGSFRLVAPDKGPIITLGETPNGDMLAFCGGRVKKLEGSSLTDVSDRYGLSALGYASTMAIARDGTVWVSGEKGFTRTKDGQTTFIANPARRVWYFSSYVDQSGRLWASAKDGLYCVSGDSFRIYHNGDGVPGVIIISICETANGTLWFGHWGGGLTRFQNGVFRHIGVREGLYSDGVYQILEDGDRDTGKNLWIGSSKGIFRASLQDLNAAMDGRLSTLRCYPYGPDDGAFASQCIAGRQPSACRTWDGCMWFSAIEGVVRVNPNDLDTAPAPILMDQILINGQPYPGEKPAAAPPGDGNVELHFTALDYRNPSHLRFQYRLDGLDSGWREGDSSRTAFYTNLPPGRYRFFVQCTNTESGWTGANAFTFTLRPHYYQTVAFKAAAAFLVLGILFGASFLRLEQLRRRNLMLQDIQDLLEARNEALTASQNELMATQQALEEANARLYAQATTDGLTGLTNHRAFREQLEREWQMKERDGLPLSLLLIDVDHFKPYNDTYGHPAGDEILIAVARLLHESARDTDTVARYGGEEFVIILHRTDAENAFLVAERFRLTIAEALWPNRPITVSIGASTTAADITTQAGLIAAADIALYWSKEHGRNRVMHVSEIIPDARSLGA